MTAEELRSLFAARIKSRRKEVGLTQVELAKRLGVKQAVVSYYENPTGETYPKLDSIARIAEALATTPDYFLRMTEK